MRKSGQFFTAQIEDGDKWVYRTYFPENWTRDDVNEAFDYTWQGKEILARAGKYVIFENILQGHIRIRFIVDNTIKKVIYYYPMFDIALKDGQEEQGTTSFFAKLKDTIGGLFAAKEQEVTLDDEMRERLKNQLFQNFRKIVLQNQMDRSIQLKFVLEHEGEETADEHFIGPNESGQLPYFTPGVLTVMHEENSAFIDITDTQKEYIFTVHDNGSVTSMFQEASE